MSQMSARMRFSIPNQQVAGYLHGCVYRIYAIDWFNEMRLVVTATLIACAVLVIVLSLKPNSLLLLLSRISAGSFISHEYPDMVRQLDLTRYVNMQSMLPQYGRTTSIGRTSKCAIPMSPNNSTRRTVLTDTDSISA